MLNFTGLARAPMYDFEVTIERKASLNANQNARKRIEYVKAPNADDAKREALKRRPEFRALSARRVS